MDKALIEKIVSRYIKIFLKDKNYYAFNYDLPYKVDEKGKKKIVKKPRFIEKEGFFFKAVLPKTPFNVSRETLIIF